MNNSKNIQSEETTRKAINQASFECDNYSTQEETKGSSGNNSPLRLAIKWVKTDIVKFVIQQTREKSKRE